MSLEIERKFLVVSDAYRMMASEVHTIEQGYISREPDGTVRVRVLDEQGFITVKTRNCGAVRNEWEFEIPVAEAREMLATACRNGLISKRRYIVPVADGLRWEVDEFSGKHDGLVIAEIELPEENTPFERPDFVGDEVTGDERYYNSNLI